MEPNCKECQYNQACCNTDSWRIALTPEEATKFIHTKLPDGQFILASTYNGYCYYLDHGLCSCYENRPDTCKNFNCLNIKDTNIMKDLQRKIENTNKNLGAKFSGFFVAFVFNTNRHKLTSDLKITDKESGKEITLKPVQVFGESEDEVKETMIRIIKEPFKKEDI